MKEKEVISGFAFHCHHEKLAEWVTDYTERVKFIKACKPESEQKLRLRLFKMIPMDRLPEELVAAWEDYRKAKEACDKAKEAYNKAEEAYNKAREAYNNAWEDYRKAGEACGKAGEACGKAKEAYEPQLIKLHNELCTDCTWDGHTIFSKGEK